MPNKKDLGTRYLTINEIIEAYPVTERTLRRWTKDGTLTVIHDHKGHIKIALEDIEQIMEHRQLQPGPLRQQAKDMQIHLAALEEALHSQERLFASLKEQVYDLAERVEKQECLIALLLQQAPETPPAADLNEQIASLLDRIGRPRAQRHSADPMDAAQKRGLPPGTLRLIDFAQAHHVKLWDIKRLYWSEEIPLEIRRRDETATRNKQEWWITQEQHRLLAEYWREHGTAFTACEKCEQEQQEEELAQ